MLLTSFPPAVEGKEGREKPSLPPLSCQGACASKCSSSSSASSSSNPNTLAVRTEDGGRGREGIQRSDRGGRGGGKGGADQWEEERRRWEGSLRGQTPAVSGAEAVLMGGARDEGQLRSRDDSGKREEGVRVGLYRKPVPCRR